MWPSLTQRLALMLASLASTIKPLNMHKDAGTHAYTPANMTLEGHSLSTVAQTSLLTERLQVCVSRRTLALLYSARNVMVYLLIL